MPEKLPRSIWVLGLTSMFMDISSELVHSLLPIYMSSVLGASMLTIGILEGIAEATASITKVLSGFLSDYWNARKPLALFGYGLSAITKPIFPLASSIGWVATARFADRIGKGIRGAPRDALITDITPPSLRGAAFGLRQSLDSIGSFVGPLLAIAFMILMQGDLRSVLWIAALPAFISVAILFTGVEDPARTAGSDTPPIHFRDAKKFGWHFWWTVAVGSLLTLARFSEAFLVLRAQGTGIATTYVPLVMLSMSAVYMLVAYPAGAASDRVSPQKLLLAGLGALIAADVVLARASGIAMVLLGAAVWGLHMGLTQGLLSKLVADAAPTELRGTAFGIFNLFTGVAALLASLIAGALWNWYGPSATFLASAAFASVAALGLVSRPWTRFDTLK